MRELEKGHSRFFEEFAIAISRTTAFGEV